MKTQVINIINDHIAGAQRLKEASPVIVELAQTIIRSIKNGKKVLLVGNGGSAADCQHFAAELVGRFEKERIALPAIALTTDTSGLTAIGNDYGFEKVFSRQVEAIGRAGDVLIAITTSGKSKNIINALSVSRGLGLNTVVLTSNKADFVPGSVDLCLNVEADTTARVQELHILIIHAVCSLIDTYFSQEM